MFELVTFYACGVIIVGGLVASSADCHATWNGRPLRHSRLLGSLVAGALWPLTLAQLLFH